MLLAIPNVEKVGKREVILLNGVRDGRLRIGKGSGINPWVDREYFVMDKRIVREEIRPCRITDSEYECRSAERAPEEKTVRHTFDDAGFIGEVMQNKIVHRADEWDWAKQRNIELRREKEATSTPMNQTRKENLLTNRIMREVRNNDAYILVRE